MYTILHKEKLTSNELYLMEIKSPWIAESGKPGQFVIVIPDAKGERVPLTICDIDKEKESVTIVYQVVGDSTRKLAEMNEGDAVFTIVGPLGRPSELLEVPENSSWPVVWVLPLSILKPNGVVKTVSPAIACWVPEPKTLSSLRTRCAAWLTTSI